MCAEFTSGIQQGCEGEAAGGRWHSLLHNC